MKNILGLVQAAPCRIDVTFREEGGAEYKRNAVVKGKGAETEELPLYTNHDGVFGEVGRSLGGGAPSQPGGRGACGAQRSHASSIARSHSDRPAPQRPQRPPRRPARAPAPAPLLRCASRR